MPQRLTALLLVLTLPLAGAHGQGVSPAAARQAATTARWVGGGMGGAVGVVSKFVRGGGVLTIGGKAAKEYAGHRTDGHGTTQALENTQETLISSDFALGSVFGGLVGGALAAMIPVPGSLTLSRVLGKAIQSLPALIGSSIGGEVGVAALEARRTGTLNAGEILRSVDWAYVTTQVIGSALGMNLAAAGIAAGVLPALTIGSFALTPVIAGVVGAIVADYLLTKWRQSRAGAAAPSSNGSASGEATTRVKATSARPRPGSGGEPLVPDPTDPYADLPAVPCEQPSSSTE